MTKTHRVSFTKVVLEYYVIEIEWDGGALREDLIAEKARRRVAEEPGRHQLGHSDVAFITTEVREI